MPSFFPNDLLYVLYTSKGLVIEWIVYVYKWTNTEGVYDDGKDFVMMVEWYILLIIVILLMKKQQIYVVVIINNNTQVYADKQDTQWESNS